MTQRYLYRTEFKGIQGWILATDKMRELVGGSDRVERFVAKVSKSLGDAVQAAAAGGLTVYFDDREALEVFVAEWPIVADRNLPGMQMVQAWVPMGAKQHTPREWGDLQQRLAAARNQSSPDLPHAGPLVARAGRSGLPAVRRGKGRVLLDRAMAVKERAATGQDAAPDSLADKLRTDDPSLSFQQDIDKFGEGYVATIHIDANSVGARLQDTSINFKKFALTLEEATLRAARRAIRAVPADDPSAPLPIRPIVIGGDDFTVVCRGRDALTLTRAYLMAFEDETWRVKEHLGGRGLRACAGVVLARPGWPFASSHALAEELCRAAKGYCKAQSDPQGNTGVSGLAFHRVTTSLVAEWDDLVADELVAKSGDGVLTGNPFTLEEFDRLIEAWQPARKLPRGSLRQWVSLARQDEAAASRHWDRMRDIAQERKIWADFASALDALGLDAETGWSVTKNSSGKPWSSVPDLLEVTAIDKAGRVAVEGS